MSTRRKSIGRGDEAAGPILDPLASQAMARGESKEKVLNHRYGTPQEGKYSRRLGGEFGSSVQNLQ